jgi:hypothetical protein
MDLVDAAGNQIVGPARGLKDNEISLLDQPIPINFTDHDIPSYVVRHALDPESAERLWTSART